MKKTIVSVLDMDCLCEVNMIKMRLTKFNNIFKLDADIAARKFVIIHDEDENEIVKAIEELKLNSSHIATNKLNLNQNAKRNNKFVFTQNFNHDTNLAKSRLNLSFYDIANNAIKYSKISDQNSDFYASVLVNSNQSAQKERRILFWALGINFIFFVTEIIYGFVANSMGLVADSLDMLSDSLVYAMAFFAVYATLGTQKRVAFAAGVSQAGLAGIGFFEVIRRFFGDSYGVDYTMMMVVSSFALVANYICLRLLNQSKSDKPHIKASQIFTSNDIVINLGVIVAGALVMAFGSNLPDLIVGAAVFIVVTRGAIRILALAK